MGNIVARDERSIRGSLDAFPYLVVEEWIASYKLFKVARCMHEEYGHVVVKVFHQADGKKDKRVERAVEEIRRIALHFREACPLWLTPHVAPYDSIEVSDDSVLLVRQHHLRSLNQRLYSKPHLLLAEKKWIAWQMLAAICELHAANLWHGDIKTDNVFVTSSGHAILTDLAYPFKPTYVPTDDPAEVSFYFEPASDHVARGRCYLAPERFYSEVAPTSVRASFAMDVFSLGCTLLEIFLDGVVILDLPGLHQYRSGQAVLDQHFAKCETNGMGDIVELLRAMTDLHAPNRPKPSEAIRRWNTLCSPSFTSLLFPLYNVLHHPLYRLPDMRIWLYRRNLSRIVQMCGLDSSIVDPVCDVDIISQYDIIAAAKNALPQLGKQLCAAGSDWTPPLIDFSSRYAHGFFDYWAKPEQNPDMISLLNDLFTSKNKWTATNEGPDTLRLSILPEIMDQTHYFQRNIYVGDISDSAVRCLSSMRMSTYPHYRSRNTGSMYSARTGHPGNLYCSFSVSGLE